MNTSVPRWSTLLDVFRHLADGDVPGARAYAALWVQGLPEGERELAERARRALDPNRPRGPMYHPADTTPPALGHRLPTIDEVGGSDPEFTGGVESAEYVRRMREGGGEEDAR